MAKTWTKKHGLEHTPEYSIWVDMRRRCQKPHRPDFKRYGGRGITVCDRWLDSFENFYTDMGQRPSPKHSIDRIDNDGNYEPGNCRWATREVQDANKGSRQSQASFVETAPAND